MRTASTTRVDNFNQKRTARGHEFCPIKQLNLSSFLAGFGLDFVGGGGGGGDREGGGVGGFFPFPFSPPPPPTLSSTNTKKQY